MYFYLNWYILINFSWKDSGGWGGGDNGLDGAGLLFCRGPGFPSTSVLPVKPRQSRGEVELFGCNPLSVRNHRVFLTWWFIFLVWIQVSPSQKDSVIHVLVIPRYDQVKKSRSYLDYMCGGHGRSELGEGRGPRWGAIVAPCGVFLSEARELCVRRSCWT